MIMSIVTRPTIGITRSLIIPMPLPLALRRPVFGLLGRVYPKADWAPRVFRGKTTLQALARDSVQAYFHSMSILRDDMRSRLYSNTFKAQLAGYNAIEVFQRHAAKANHEDALSLIQYLDLKTYLVGDINTKVDRASMAHSLEVRVPFLDHAVVEYCARIPPHLKVQGTTTKYLLKRAARGLVPDRIIDKRKFGFFNPAVSGWFASQADHATATYLLDDGAKYREFLDSSEVAVLASRRARADGGRRDQLLLSVLMLELWLSAFLPRATASSERTRTLA